MARKQFDALMKKIDPKKTLARIMPHCNHIFPGSRGKKDYSLQVWITIFEADGSKLSPKQTLIRANKLFTLCIENFSKFKPEFVK